MAFFWLIPSQARNNISFAFVDVVVYLVFSVEVFVVFMTLTTMSWIGIDLLGENSRRSLSSTTVESITRQSSVTAFTNRNSSILFTSPGEDAFDFWYFGEGEDNNSNRSITSYSDDLSVATGNINNANGDFDDDGEISMRSNSTYEGHHPSFATTTTPAENTLDGMITTQTEECTVPDTDATNTRASYFPFTFIPNSIVTSIRSRIYPNIIPTTSAPTIFESSILSQSSDINHNSNNDTSSYRDQILPVSEPRSSAYSDDGDCEGVTIVPSVRSSDDMILIANQDRKNTPLGDVVMFSTNIDPGDLIDTQVPHPENREMGTSSSSTSSGSVNGTHIDGSRVSSLSLHPSSVESSVVTEWASIHGLGSQGSGSPIFMSNDGGIEIIPEAASDPPFQLGSRNTIDRSKRRKENRDNEEDDDSAELDSLSSSFFENLNLLRQATNPLGERDNHDSIESGMSSTSTDQWYLNLRTDRDWDELRENARTILAAVDNDNGTTDMQLGERVSTSNDTEREEEIRLARLFLEQEEILRSIAIVNETKNKRQKWKIAGDIALMAATAAISFIILSKSKR